MKGAPGRVSKHRAWYKGREKLCHAALHSSHHLRAQSLCQAPTSTWASPLGCRPRGWMGAGDRVSAGCCGDAFASLVLSEGLVQIWRRKNCTHFSAAAILRVIKFINCVY